LKLPAMDGEAVLPLVLLEPDAAELFEALPVVPKPDDVGAAGVVVTVMPKPVVVAGGVYLTVVGGLEELLDEAEAEELAAPEPELDPEADAELAADDEEALGAPTLKVLLVA